MKRLIGNTFLAACALVAALVAWGVHDEARAWERFKSFHACKIDTDRPSHVALSKTGWRCNDGVTYWR